MTPRSLFNLILKILGVFFIKDILDALSRSISVLVYFPQYASRKEAIYNLAVTLPQLVLYCFFVGLLLFATNFLINLFKLDRGTNGQSIAVNWHRSDILRIAVVIAGGWMVVSGSPEFIRQLVYYYQERKIYLTMAHPDMSYLLMTFFKLLIGVLLVLCNGTVVNIIELSRKNPGDWYRQVRQPFSSKKKKVV